MYKKCCCFFFPDIFTTPAGLVLRPHTRKLSRGHHHRSSQPVEIQGHRQHLQLAGILQALWMRSRCCHEPETQVWAVVRPRGCGAVHTQHKSRWKPFTPFDNTMQIRFLVSTNLGCSLVQESFSLNYAIKIVVFVCLFCTKSFLWLSFRTLETKKKKLQRVKNVNVTCSSQCDWKDRSFLWVFTVLGDTDLCKVSFIYVAKVYMKGK